MLGLDADYWHCSNWLQSAGDDRIGCAGIGVKLAAGCLDDRIGCKMLGDVRIGWGMIWMTADWINDDDMRID